MILMSALYHQMTHCNKRDELLPHTALTPSSDSPSVNVMPSHFHRYNEHILTATPKYNHIPNTPIFNQT